MKQQILEILDESTSNGMKADDIVQLLEQRRQDAIEKWEDILQEDERSGYDVLYGVVDDMITEELSDE
ncbi:MAG: hypothetical protein Q4A74_00190 [Cardiobacteriaceae bacterium]|nr:hypothetical protein [Cardiobacteriaceae bacterium]